MRGERLIPFAAPTIGAPHPRAVRLLLASAVVAFAPHALELPIGAIAAFLAAVGWRFASEQWNWYRPGKWQRVALALATIVFAYRYYGTLLGRDPGVTLLVCLTGLKLLELRILRDYMLSAFLLFLLTLSTFLYGQSLALGLYALVAVSINTAALLHLSRAAPLGFEPTVRWTLRLAGQALPIMLVLYVLFPRLPAPLWGIPFAEGGSVTGVPEVMRPGNIQSLSESPQPVFRVSFDGATPAPPLLYWRARVLWDTDGRAWYAGPPLPAADAVSFRPRGEPVRYEVTLEPQNRPWLYALDLPALIPAGARVRAGYVLERERAARERVRYDMLSYPQYATGALSNAERGRALSLPRAVSPRVHALSSTWRRGAGDAAVVSAALDHFRREPFVYTLTPPRLGSDPVDEFLFETRRGFCEHYAAAFVTLMRAAGIPSRVVLGYQGGEFNPAGDYLIVRQADAHAWAEVWLAGRGWVRVDPTVAVAPERVELGIDATRRLRAQGVTAGELAADAVLQAMRLGMLEHAWLRTRLGWDYANFSWYRWVGGYDLERQEAVLARLGLKEYVLPAMVGGVALLVLFYGLPRARRARADPVVAAYTRFCGRLAHVGLERAPTEGALAFAERCVRLRPDLLPAINAITEGYVALRYGPMRAPEELHSLRRAVRQFRPRRAA